MPEEPIWFSGQCNQMNLSLIRSHYNDDVLFGENWNNHDIDHKTRCIITVVALMSSGVTDSSLKFHLENAKKAGVTRKEIAAVVTHTAFYAGCASDIIGINRAA